MMVCREYRIPHSEFLSWSKDDRDKAIWQFVFTLTACPSCNTRREEWLESAGGDRRAYVPKLDRCPGCEALESFVSKLDRERLGKGIKVQLVPNLRR